MKPTILSIGVIDKQQQLHKDFAIRTLDYRRDKECVFNYELYKEGQKRPSQHCSY